MQGHSRRRCNHPVTVAQADCQTPCLLALRHPWRRCDHAGTSERNRASATYGGDSGRRRSYCETGRGHGRSSQSGSDLGRRSHDRGLHKIRPTAGCQLPGGNCGAQHRGRWYRGAGNDRLPGSELQLSTHCQFDRRRCHRGLRPLWLYLNCRTSCGQGAGVQRRAHSGAVASCGWEGWLVVSNGRVSGGCSPQDLFTPGPALRQIPDCHERDQVPGSRLEKPIPRELGRNKYLASEKVGIGRCKYKRKVFERYVVLGLIILSA